MAASSQPASPDPQIAGSSYPLILDHVLSYPGTYEIPLRTMYTLNSTPRAQPLPQLFKQAATSSNSGRETPSNSQQDATMQFTSSLMSQISQLPSQPCSLPPSFINSFVRRCFTVEIEKVDFPQSLTALDYLKDLELRRRREAAAAFRRLCLDPAMVDEQLENYSQEYPAMTSWVRSIRDKEKKVEALYTQIYIGLRRWILINELQLPPFNKHNAVAMLNTLYPPVTAVQPTKQLTPTVLKQQRDGWFRYITAVEQNGGLVLANLVFQGRRPGDKTGWPALRNSLDMYLRTATVVIAECSTIPDLNHFNSPSTTIMIGPEEKDSNTRKRGRKADSGVGFEPRRPSTSDSNKSTGRRGGDNTNISPTSGSSAGAATTGHQNSGTTSTKSSSTLERLAREFRRLRPKKSAPAVDAAAVSTSTTPVIPSSSVDDSVVPTTTSTQPSASESKKRATIRKMKSLGAIGEARQNAKSVGKKEEPTPEMPAVDEEMMKREFQRVWREREIGTRRV